MRAYDAMISAMDFNRLGIEIDPHKVGNTAYDPKAMVKLLVYSYSYGVRRSRKIEREANYNLSFLWLTGGLTPDHKTIAEFPGRNKSGLKGVLKQCARICMDLDLISGNTLFVDGTKIKAVVPNIEQASGKEPKEFDKKKFQYDKDKDCYTCPEGMKLVYVGDEPERKRREYRIEEAGICLSCKNFGKCARSKKGGTIKRLHNEELMEKFIKVTKRF